MKSETKHTKAAFINNFYTNTQEYKKDEDILKWLAEECITLDYDKFYTYYDNNDDCIDIHIYNDDFETIITWWFNQDDNVEFTLTIFKDKNHVCGFEGTKEVLKGMFKTLRQGIQGINTLSIMFNNFDEIGEQIKNGNI